MANGRIRGSFYLTLEECKLILQHDPNLKGVRFYLTLEECKYLKCS